VRTPGGGGTQMPSDPVVTGDGAYEVGRSSGQAAEALAAALSHTGVLNGLTWRLHISARRRTVGLTIERDASVTVVVPAGSEIGQVVAALEAKRPWLVRRTVERARQLGEHPAKQVVSGENFPYLGRNQRLLVVTGQPVPVRREGGRLCLRAVPPQDGAQAIIDWYARTGAGWLDPRSRSWAGRLEVSPKSVDIRDLGRRWGTTGARGEVTLHWALFQLQPMLVDYILVHELVHLVEPHHGPAFWQRLGRAMPDYHERLERLADLGRRVWLGDVHDGMPSVQVGCRE
jgi:predicted metal-dependent hydrolase